MVPVRNVKMCTVPFYFGVSRFFITFALLNVFKWQELVLYTESFCCWSRLWAKKRICASPLFGFLSFQSRYIIHVLYVQKLYMFIGVKQRDWANKTLMIIKI